MYHQVCVSSLTASLAALIYQHTITPLALPTKLLLPEPGTNAEIVFSYSSQYLLYNLYIGKLDTKDLYRHIIDNHTSVML